MSICCLTGYKFAVNKKVDLTCVINWPTDVLLFSAATTGRITAQLPVVLGPDQTKVQWEEQ